MDFKHFPDLSASLRAHRYQEYLDRYREVAGDISEQDADLYLPDMAFALMALRRYDDALVTARELHQTGERTPKFARDLGRGLDIMGACQWMLGRGAEAISTWQSLCVGIRSGKYQFAKDPAGGAYAGLLFWFGAVGANDEDLLTKARLYLENRVARLAKLDAEEVWPVPVVRFVLGQAAEIDMMRAVLREPGFLGGGEIAVSSEIGRQHLSVAYLVAGAGKRRRVGGGHSGIEYFRKAVSLENPINEIAWYLARYEVEKMT